MSGLPISVTLGDFENVVGLLFGMVAAGVFALWWFELRER